MEDLTKFEWYGLRFGNWYNQKGTDIAEMMTPNNLDNFLAGAYESIKLTDEWMRRFDFEAHNSNIYSKALNESGLKKLVVFRASMLGPSWSIGFADYYTGKENSETMPTKVNYVHELQTIFFSLTGEELELEGAK